MTYNANSILDRHALAAQLLATLDAKGLIQYAGFGRGEIVYLYECAGEVAIKVYTGCTMIDGAPCARAEGADAIRVAAVKRYAPGEDARGFIKAKRVNRTGTVDAIVGRTVSRLRMVWKEAKARHDSQRSGGIALVETPQGARSVSGSNGGGVSPGVARMLARDAAAEEADFQRRSDAADREFERMAYGRRD